MTYAGSEVIYEFRKSPNGKLYTPVSYPSEHGQGGFITNASGSWRVINPPSVAPARYVNDLVFANNSGSDIWLFGKTPDPRDPGVLNRARATVWRSTDTGATWKVMRTEQSNPPDYHQGGEQYIWGVALNGKVYMQATSIYPQAPMRVFNTATNKWSSMPYKGGCEQQLIMKTIVFDGKIICDTRIGKLTLFDGKNITTKALATPNDEVVSFYKSDDGYLYILGYWYNDVYRTKSFSQPWEKIGRVSLPPAGDPIGRSIAVHDGYLYIGDSNATIWRRAL